jgi:biofilm PGA synthesis N-glycosyltransferase PgaC
MNAPALTYGVVTPARDEDENLPRLAASMRAQTVRPEVWIVVDDGSVDRSKEIVTGLAQHEPWIRLLEIPAGSNMARGGPVVRSFEAGVAALDPRPDVVVKLDADVSMEPDYFERLLAAFANAPRLGIASGSAYELKDGAWRQRFSTGTSVWGAARAYRRECLEATLPLEKRTGWDGIDEHRAQLAGWETATLLDLPFRHHRAEGMRDTTRSTGWKTQGELAHYLDYRPTYLVLRSLFAARNDVRALRMIVAYLAARLRRADRHPDPGVRGRVRELQRFRVLGRRAREKLGVNAGAARRP